jgi:hypothetical protein
MRARYAAILLVVLGALLAQGACLPHTHGGVDTSVYNAEHDLTLLAVSGTVASLPAAPLLIAPAVTAPVVAPTPPPLVSAVTRNAESRAPPTA